ncbi:MAG: hypothetical protein ABSH11_05845 [Verrucomicrobiota bacterium]|jgi:hypothetical protein
MRRHSSFDGKAQSLVFTFAGQLLEAGDFGAPEPDFLKWLETSLFADVGSASDSVDDDKLSKEEREAWKLFRDAIQATGNLLDFYKEDLPLFQKVAGELMFLPCFLSRHPDNPRFNQVFLENSRLSQHNMASAREPKRAHLARQSWPVRYAYAIINAIDLTLDTYGEDLPLWSEIYGYGVRHPIPLETYEAAAKTMGWDEEKIRKELRKYEGRYQILPCWTKSLEKLRRPFNTAHAIDYWRIGKEMILEEMLDFHTRPEWADYRDEHKRTYQGGAKTGAIRHAIFKDILLALHTIAGTNKRSGKALKRKKLTGKVA